VDVVCNSVLVGGEWSVSRPDRFIPDKELPVTSHAGGWVGPRAGLDDARKEETLDPTGTRTRNPRPSSLQRAAIPNALWAELHFSAIGDGGIATHEAASSGCHILLVPSLRPFGCVYTEGGEPGTRNKCSCEVVLTAVLLARNLRNPPEPGRFLARSLATNKTEKQTLLGREIRFGRQNS
jgi:hypothetical protein